MPAQHTRLWPPPKDAWLPTCGVALIYVAHWIYGALISDVALVMGMAAALLLGAVLIQPRLRDDLLRLRGLGLPALLFAAVIGVALWTLTPWIPGGPHPVWAYVGLPPGASTIDKSTTLVAIIQLLGLACMFAVGAATGARDERARYAVRLMIVGGLVFGLWAFLASATGSIYQTQGRRLEAHFLNPNTAGTVFAVLLLLSVTELVRQLRGGMRRGDLTRILPLATTTLTFAVCLLASASRGAMMALLGGLVVFILVQLATGSLKPSRALGAALVGLAALIAVVTMAGEGLVDRLFQSHEAGIVRTAIWDFHWRAFLDSPLFGYGLGAAETVNKTLISHSNYELLWNIKAILNVYLQWLEEAGLAGAAPMFLCIAVVVVTVLRGALRRSRMTGLLAGLLAIDAVFLLHGATDFGLEVPSVAALWAWLLGLQFSLSQGSSRR
ncbi:O-antigen ligase family protein [Phenylobacterium hankyongense]|uniref:O-antigen ligase family protein n=1 Tax=Phenylobacterium hankyongense TaxID=1813876 RepID=A0A328B6Y4_9CAUL|nr:O-antigen ligase family protein [Phenylobacterium hankyongense]RAK60778.1 O-antigen ligase family protein [Phenylobacterium hankyongense]